MYRVVVIGGGWSGCAAALSARKAGADVVLLEKTDLLLGLGNVGGIMRNNGRFTAAEENVAMGAHELFEITDRCSRHVNIDFPGHQHASLYDVTKVEPCVRRLLREKGVDIRLMARAVDVVVRKRDMSDGKIAKESIIEKIVLAGGEEVDWLYRANGELPYIWKRVLHVYIEMPRFRTKGQHKRQGRWQ